MAINDDNKGITQATAPQPTTTATPGITSGVIPQNDKWGVFNIGSMTRLTFTGETLNKLVAALTEIYTSMNIGGVNIKLIPIDRAKETQLYLSSVAVCVSDNNGGPVVYHTVLIESSNEPLTPRVDTIQGKQIQVDLLSSAVFDNDYNNYVYRILQNSFGANVKLRPCAGQMVYREFNINDKEEVQKLAINALKPPLMDVLSTSPGFNDMDLSKYNGDANFTVEMQFNNNSTGTLTDYAGMPVRAPVMITMKGTANQRTDRRTINGADQAVSVSRLGGYVDMVWGFDPTTDVPNPYAQIQQPIPKFLARYVMTTLENELLMTVPSQLLALATAASLGENANWFSAMMPKATGKGVDLSDVGVLNIEANIMNEQGPFGTRIDTKSAKFTSNELSLFLRAAVKPGLIYSLDVSECGADTWYNEVFLAAAAGDQGAHAAIVKAADKLTGGEFSKRWGGGPVVETNNEIIQLGYYVNKDGQKRDIREIDYLAVMNLVGEKDPTKGSDWTQTYLNLGYTIEQRLDARRKMINELCGGEVRYTGTARRVTFMKVFVEALVQSCVAAGLHTSITSNMLGIDYTSQRSSWQNMAGTTYAPTTSNMFMNGNFNQPNYGNQSYGASRQNNWVGGGNY